MAGDTGKAVDNVVDVSFEMAGDFDFESRIAHYQDTGTGVMQQGKEAVAKATS